MIAEDVVDGGVCFSDGGVYFSEPVDFNCGGGGFVDEVAEFDDEIDLGLVEALDAFREFAEGIAVVAAASGWLVGVMEVGEEADAQDGFCWGICKKSGCGGEVEGTAEEEVAA